MTNDKEFIRKTLSHILISYPQPRSIEEPILRYGLMFDRPATKIEDEFQMFLNARDVERDAARDEELVEGLAEWHANYVFDKSACGKSSIRYKDIEESAKNQWRGLAIDAIKAAREGKKVK